VSTEQPGLRFEIGHVLFIDIVGYSNLLTNEQRELLRKLNNIVRATKEFRTADSSGKLLRLPTGDGMALAFFTSPDAPVRCALEIAQALKDGPKLPVRMGIHSGPVDPISDVDERPNIAGAGINMAQRVMDCGDAGHILLSKRAADDLAQYAEWRPRLHELGEVEVKHGQRIGVTNFYFDGIGNPALPEKLKHAARAKRRRTVLWLALMSLLLIAASAGWLLFQRARSKAALAAPDKSIAILPLENLSDDKENAFFADGIHEDILTTLGKIRDLKVISRTSVMEYRGATRNLRDIAKALGVANVLEGSVRRSGNRVLVNVQLIDARNDRHIWAERYDRTLADSIGLQGELATQIASALQAHLAPEEKATLETKPTDNPEAYALYLKGLSTDDEIAATQLFEQAIALDPNFALARTRLSITNTFLAEPDANKERIAKARHEAEEALRLSPSLAEAHLALGIHLFLSEKNYTTALNELSIAAARSPNNPRVLRWMSKIYRRQGRWRESLALMERQLDLDPLDVAALWEAGIEYVLVRDWSAATATYKRWLDIEPDSAGAKIPLAWLEVYRNGNVAAAREILSQIPAGIDPDGDVSEARFNLCMLQRDFTAAAQVLANFPEKRSGFVNTWLKTFFEGQLALARGDAKTAQEIFAASAAKLEPWARDHPTILDAGDLLALIYALMGRKEEAIAQALRVVELEPESQDAFWGAGHQANLALVCARTGENDKAVPLIERLLSTPGPIGAFGGPETMTLANLRLGWLWDPLRQDPRFQKIVGGPEPKTIY
jgi:TolB-like protein